MNCVTCDEPIPEKRLIAMPDADQCVVCLEANGDVERMKRYDDYTGDEKQEVHFAKPDQYLDTVLKRNGSMKIHYFYTMPAD